jgi:NAD+--asparagine ADP-ribosyltransferase
MSEAITALQNIYFAIQLKLNDMLASCQTQAQRDQVMSQYVAARQNYWQAINKVFHDDDPSVKALVTQANAAATTLTSINTSLGDIATVLNDLTKAVTIGSEIAAKVATF